MVDDTVGGLLLILLCTVLASLLVGGAFYAREIAARLVSVGRRLHLVPPQAPVPAGLPLERVVRDLRRLQPEARRPRQGTTNAKYRGVVAAYDDLLLAACHALEVRTDLASLPEGFEREAERLRIESELERAGVPLHTTS